MAEKVTLKITVAIKVWENSKLVKNLEVNVIMSIHNKESTEYYEKSSERYVNYQYYLICVQEIWKKNWEKL